MLNLSVLQGIVSDPPADKLALYAKLCEAHTFTFGDSTVIGSAHDPNDLDAPNNVYVVRHINDADAITATCHVGKTVDGVTTYHPRLGLYTRTHQVASSFEAALETTVLGKSLGAHLCDAMGYDDYIIVDSGIRAIVTIEGQQGNLWVMPLVLPPAIEFISGSTHRVEGNSQNNLEILGTTVYASAAARLETAISVDASNPDAKINPPAWFYITSGYTAACVPLPVYITDDQCWATVNDRINELQQEMLTDLAGTDTALTTDVASLVEGYSTIVSLVGSLTVFGNTVKEVTDRYHTVTQYIPRP